ncbi:MAG: VWA domain-containing protein [Candidatus Electrothrix sp. AR3]|nr:VWA domain-containing protein [Candidatus Electrothrix sp. AR3]
MWIHILQKKGQIMRFKKTDFMLIVLFMIINMAMSNNITYAQTALGEIEGRPAPVARRKCMGGTNADNLCNEDADCPGSTCFDRNVFNLSVAIQFSATGAQLTVIKDALSEMSDVLMDVTDGQAEIGQFTLHNNAFSTDADIRIYAPSTGVWWWANTGAWKTGGSIHVSYDYVASSANPGNVFVHEFTHLVFDARDEYQGATLGCTASLPSGTADCPHADAQAAGEDPCIMDVSSNTEYCWGQGNPANLTNFATGNHDATNITEQSRCRSNRSVWDQVVWSWPNSILEPATAPDPGTNGVATNSPKFIEVDSTRRVVLVLDESGSMSLENPTRLSRLQIAALDFVALAEDGTELGIVSYSTDGNPTNGHAEVPVSALTTNRSTWNNAIIGLTASGTTNIGDGLARAHAMLIDAGLPLPANTFIVLMTDGINNQPLPNPTGHLSNELDELLYDSIPVFVTCTGSDWNLGSQCANIALATNGFSVDSADSSDLQESFIYLHEKTRGAEPVETLTGDLSQGGVSTFLVEPQAASVTFTLTWKNDGSNVQEVAVKEPNGTTHSMLQMSMGRFLRFEKPIPGNWQVIINGAEVEKDTYTAKAYVQSQSARFSGAANKGVVQRGESIKLFAYPQYYGSIVNQSREFEAEVIRPDGIHDKIIFSDKGRLAQTGDDLADDGQYTALYNDTKLSGVYTVIAQLAFSDGWESNVEGTFSGNFSQFKRELRITVAVDEASSPLSCAENTQAYVSNLAYFGFTCEQAIPTAEADLTKEYYRNACQETYNQQKMPNAVNQVLVTACRDAADPKASGVYLDVDICCPVSNKTSLVPVRSFLLKSKKINLQTKRR